MKAPRRNTDRRLDFSTIDRRMALAFGLLILGLMLAVSLAIGWYVRTAAEREQNRLVTLTTQLLSDAVGRVSFSGQYQVQLLLDKIAREQSGIAYVRLIDTQGRIVADSHPLPNARTHLPSREFARLAPLLQAGAVPQIRLQTLEDGQPVREVSLAYRGGFNNEFQGIMQVGISGARQDTAMRDDLFYVAGLLGALLLAGILATLAVSRHFGRPVRQLAANMADQRHRLGEILDALGAGTWEWNLATNQVQVNQEWARISGYLGDAAQPITKENIQDQCHPDDVALFQHALDAHLSGQAAGYLCEYRILHPDGQTVWVLDSGQIVQRDDQGRPVRMAGARFDITDRRRAEQEFHQESERFRALAKASGTGVWEWDANTGHLWCSPEYFSMLGRDPADYADLPQQNLNAAWKALLHPDDRARATRSFSEYLASDLTSLYENEFRLAHADGSWIWVWSRGSTLRDAEGRPTSRTIGTHINVDALKQTENRLRESQERLQLISNNIPNCMVFQVDCGPSGASRRYTYVSEGVETLHGVQAAAVLQDPDLIRRQLNPADQAMIEAHERQCLENLDTFKVEVRATLPDGRQHWSLIVSSPRRLSNGHLVFDGIELDVTARKLREQEIERLNSSLEQRVQERTKTLRATLDRLRHTQDELLQSEKLASLGALVAGVSHELNTPIGNAVTVASTLVDTHRRFRRQTETGLTRSALAGYLEDVEEGGRIIERNLSRAAELIGSFKQLAADQASDQRRAFDLHSVVDEVIMAMQPAVRKTPIQLTSDVPPGLMMDSYPGPLGQVLMNLINNALIHAFEGRQSGNILLDLDLAKPAGSIVLIVQDDGCGIPEANLKRIFDPFFSTRLNQGGSGLGLHITHTLVTGLLGGRIRVDSTPQKGTRFTLTLPLRAPASPRHRPAR
ncbi:PAS domain-containing protein [Castellaniella hirudinis]|uniref:PAS domain-containing protein n=1 Tax=Castellaniella hirudinis TaxID=1144617 RepID=UPI0039C45ADC